MRYLFKYLLLCLTTGMFAYNAGAQIDHETIDWEAVDSNFYKQYDPEISPKWLFPIIFEEGTGMRDTVYLGYHSEHFHREIVPVDTEYFDASIGGGGGDTISQKVLIRQLNHNNRLYYSFYFYKAIYPVYAYWDVKRLRSDSLPFEDEPFSPRSMILWEWDMPGLPYDGMTGCNTHDPIFVADTILKHWCSARDSLYFSSDWMQEGLPAEWFAIEVIQYVYPPPNRSSIETTLQKGTFALYPNPAQEHLVLSMDLPQSGTYKILNLHGQIVQRKASDNNKQIEFNVKELSPGSYWLWAEFENGETLLEQFIVSH